MPDKQQTLDLEPTKSGPVECLGMIFESEEARRAYFLERLREKLQDPEFRKIPGFPKGTDEDILRMSDPPYYTACPNPFLKDFVSKTGLSHDPTETYHREPLAVDVSVGKSDMLYKAHSYHTKVPHLAILPSIEHYTVPGDTILDGFCGSGMTGVAALWSNMQHRGNPPRRAILNDLSPAASFIAANYTTPFSVTNFRNAAKRLMEEVHDEWGWMYTTNCPQTGQKCMIEYTVWSEVFRCPSCSQEITFMDEALDSETGHVRSQFPCPICSATLNKDRLERCMETVYDPYMNQPYERVKFIPVLVVYERDGARHKKELDEADRATLERIASTTSPYPIPTMAFPLREMYHGSRLGPKGFTHVHRLFLQRPLISLSALWAKASSHPDTRMRNQLLYFVEQAIWGMSVLARYAPTHFSQVNRYLSGVYYVASQIVDVSPTYILGGKLDRLITAFSRLSNVEPAIFTSTGSCSALLLPDNSIDYVFTDPPFGENIFYADLNFLVESWHGVMTRSENEAIVDRAKAKDLQDYNTLMTEAFREYYRVLKPGRWMTVVFSNSANAVWRAIQDAMGRAGFVIADVRTLDKQQGSYRQVTSTAVKQDLVISAYKPAESMTSCVTLQSGTRDSVWTFVNGHLAHVPLFVGNGKESVVVAERTAQMLLDRMIAFHVQRGVSVPIDAGDFFRDLEQRYARRDGMYFLQDQVIEYDKRRAKVETVRQLEFDVTDEASAILWVRVELDRKPQPFQDLQPTFMRESRTWAGHEKTVELKEILEENFLLYDGSGPVPAQIHTYLSTNFKDMRGLSKVDSALKAKATDRWYVPDPNKQSDLDQLRTKRLLKEFAEYKESKQKKLKLFRTEAVRAGFRAAYDQKDYRTIVNVAKKLPEEVIQEDEKLLMYYDVASMRLGED